MSLSIPPPSLTIVETPTKKFTDQIIPVEFVVLHYTAGDLAATMDLLIDRPDVRASCHLVLDRDGTFYELVPCLTGTTKRAWHAGVSRWKDGGRTWESFNDFSIGIEIVNRNGNLLPYTEAQYQALHALMSRLKDLYPTLGDPNRIVGHEQISGFRGKIDPGILFDWARFFRENYPGMTAPARQSVISPELLNDLKTRQTQEPQTGSAHELQAFWHELSSYAEQKAKV